MYNKKRRGAVYGNTSEVDTTAPVKKLMNNDKEYIFSKNGLVEK